MYENVDSFLVAAEAFFCGYTAVSRRIFVFAPRRYCNAATVLLLRPNNDSSPHTASASMKGVHTRRVLPRRVFTPFAFAAGLLLLLSFQCRRGIIIQTTTDDDVVFGKEKGFIPFRTLHPTRRTKLRHHVAIDVHHILMEPQQQHPLNDDNKIRMTATSTSALMTASTNTATATETAPTILSTVCDEQQGSCCVRTLSHLINPYYPYSNNKNRSSPTMEDRISSIDMKLIADVHFGTLAQPQEYSMQLIELSSHDNLSCLALANGLVIFVDATNIQEFATTLLPNITTQFVLVTGDSDWSMPGDRLTPSQVSSLLHDTRVLHWYAKNCDRNPNPRRFTCLPIGISQWDNQRATIQSYYERGVVAAGSLSSLQQEGLDSTRAYFYSDKKNITLLVSFAVGNNIPERQALLDMACQPNGMLYPHSQCALRVSADTYYQLMTRSKFVLSPRGIGLDCFRTYEALYLGAFPIVKTSSLDELYRHLPVLIVQNWTDLAKEGVLERSYQDFMQRMDTFQWERLYKGYWYAKFRSHYPKHVQIYETND